MALSSPNNQTRINLKFLEPIKLLEDLMNSFISFIQFSESKIQMLFQHLRALMGV